MFSLNDLNIIANALDDGSNLNKDAKQKLKAFVKEILEVGDAQKIGDKVNEIRNTVIDELKADQATITAAKDELKAQDDFKNKAKGELSDEIKQKVSKLEQLEAGLSAKNTEVKSLNEQLKTNNQEIAQLNTEAEKLKTDLKDQKDEAEQLKEKNKELEAKNKTTEQPKQGNGARYTATVGMGLAAGLVAFIALERTVRLDMLVMIGIAVASALVVGGVTYAALPSTQVNGAEAQEVNVNNKKK
ncbi:hypothetical protein [Wolbachia endosymbiont (group A) of Cheilosia soror]|uniref:hypothetical protein n=1 Tax=Wolbachia endosymbiont (group A) of Cheilosia soror TaxID=2953995 RepID=UPI0021F8E66E|nr:hypothetical protein [Wolbachia endosymbiont (group A) of Cheilosia soror]